MLIKLLSGGGISNHNLFEKIISLENLFLAWQEFRRGKRGKFETQQFESNLEDNLFQLNEELSLKSYKPGSYTSFCIKDPKLRHIHKAHIRDRVLYQAVFRILYQIFDKNFIYDSYSSRLDKGTHRAVIRLKAFLNKASVNNHRNTFVLKCDIKRFFDSINHRILLSLIERKVKDRDALWLIQKIIWSFQGDKGEGLPLGNVTSQLFSNIYLNELDKFVKHILKVKYYIRYCDDFVFVLENDKLADEIILRTNEFLKGHLNMLLHPEKVMLRKYSQGIDYLGFVIRPYCVTLRTKTKKRLFTRINNKNKYSYLGILKHCASRKISKKLSSFI